MCGVFMFNIFTAISQLTVLKRIYEWGYIYIINDLFWKYFFYLCVIVPTLSLI